MKAYFAHIRRDGSKEQTMGAHLLRVGNLMKEDAARIGLSSLAYLIGVLHDLGKCTAEFAEYLDWCRKNPGNYSRAGDVDHSTAGGQLLLVQYGRKNTDYRFVAEIASLVIFSHHTGLLNYYGQDGKDESSDFLRRNDKADILSRVDLKYFFSEVIAEEELNGIFEQSIYEIADLDAKIARAVHCPDDEMNEAYCFYWGMVHKLLLSMLVDADRLDSAEFELDRPLTDKWETAEIWADFSDKLERKLAGFSLPKEPKAKKIAQLRKKISDDCLKAAEEEPGIFRLCVPTGGGKTLASMRFALQHAQRYQKKRIIVVIPYTSIIDQNVKEIRDIFRVDEAILEHHSNVITEADGEDTESMDWRRILTERWDVPIIFTTQVQFLNTLFAGGNSSIRRLNSLQDSIVIFDEIQTLPVRCTFLFNAAMNFLKDFCRITAVLCTATQPPLEKLDVSINLSDNAAMTSDIEKTFEGFERVDVENCYRDGGWSAEEIASEICKSVEEIGDVLCIVNLTKKAKEIYQAVSEKIQLSDKEIQIVHLSTKMCSAHRKATLKELRRALAERKNHPEKRLVCISTQLIEAGVDVSFPVVYRALAGFSSIAQAAGRCNRHGEMEKGLVRVFDCADENLDHLKDIRHGKNIARVMLYDRAANTILSPSVMQEYFRRFYAGRTGKEMRYPLNTQNTIFDLLSANSAGVQARMGRGDRISSYFRQAFRDAGRAFIVIDSHTEAVLVPYAGGKDMIAALDDRIFDKKSIGKQMKAAQQYIVNLFSYEIKELAGLGAVWRTESGVMALREEYYNEAFGVQTEEQGNAYCLI